MEAVRSNVNTYYFKAGKLGTLPFFMEDFQKRSEFRRLLQTKFKDYLTQHNYFLIYNNESENQANSKNWVFRLIFSGGKKIEIFNDDWRDYTEYFTVKVDETEILVLNVENYQAADSAYEDLKTKLMSALTRHELYITKDLKKMLVKFRKTKVYMGVKVCLLSFTPQKNIY